MNARFNSCHDWNLIGFSLHSAVLEVTCKTGSQIVKTVFRNVIRFKCTDYLVSNIVFAIEDVTESYASWLDWLGSDLLPGRARLEQQISDGELKLFAITPSYGATLCCICESLEQLTTDDAEKQRSSTSKAR